VMMLQTAFEPTGSSEPARSGRLDALAISRALQRERSG
jgi:hypothetical protein